MTQHLTLAAQPGERNTYVLTKASIRMLTAALLRRARRGNNLTAPQLVTESTKVVYPFTGILVGNKKI